MQLFDSHCHMQDPKLMSDAESVLGRAEKARVRHMVCCGSSEEDWPDVATLCGRYDALIPAFGLHPWYAARRSPGWLDALREMLGRFSRAGVGEIGIDHAIRDRNDREQEEVFRAQLELAAKLGRAASIHCRRGWETVLDILNHSPILSRGFVVHSYSGSVEMIEPLSKIGAFFSFSGSITRPANRRGAQAARAVPVDRLLIETDAPDILPLMENSTSTVNEPANLVHVLRALAAIRNTTEDEIAKHTYDNARRLFIDE